ncbi:diphthine synthase, putative [Babesia bigemina]|uniref:diphthine methyl ester synthase n=1 Tax=Babesia bigemina TaxID=5866 RepID=A0A061D7H4_BABBI|nr:diphthine synthase, putative [Babesia bigemina]CDR94829.1 diphthine synthase, putative [Babesia bigemina]|eukprot:XP_012767015.1 diphthine synthase, putative [Babesia bigemina]
MTLTLVGLGLGAIQDITLRGLEAIKAADRVFLEIYTSALIDSSREELESFFGKPVIEADRISVEDQAEHIIQEARDKHVVLLVAGDPLSATTHCDLCMRAEHAGVQVDVIHNASIINAIGRTGLQLYRFGEVVSIPLFEKNWTPDSFYDKIAKNRRANLHTLCLLDIKVKERSVENLMANRMIFEPPRYMTVNVAIEQIQHVDAAKHEVDASTRAFGVARLGSKTAQIVAGTLEQLKSVDFGAPLHSLVICAPELHDIEEQYYQHYHCEKGRAQSQPKHST